MCTLSTTMSHALDGAIHKIPGSTCIAGAERGKPRADVPRRRDSQAGASESHVVVRTGKHCPDGFVFQDHRIMPERIENHEICEYICRHFGLPVEPAVESADFAHVKR